MNWGGCICRDSSCGTVVADILVQGRKLTEFCGWYKGDEEAKDVVGCMWLKWVVDPTGSVVGCYLTLSRDVEFFHINMA
jgi:hypothetical protein